MLRRTFITFLLIMLLAACEAQPSASTAPTVIPFPTMTPGRMVQGALPTVVALPLDGSVRSNPATAVAISLRPTATPDYSACPPAAAPALPPAPSDTRDMIDEMVRFLTGGGTAEALQTALRDTWGVLGENGLVRADVDFTGVGVPEVLVSFNAPDSGGALAIFGCYAGRYLTHYQVINPDDTPQILYLGDMNISGVPDVLYTARQCDIDDEGIPDTECPYVTRLITWDAREGRFIGLLNRPVTSLEPPIINDVDNDSVLEIVVRLTSNGTPATGPLRTGIQIYDWNGENYLLSITQFDPPRFRIQVVHQADRNVQQRQLSAAVDLYQLALSDGNLRSWFNDEPDIINSYILYRLLTVYAFTEDDRLLPAYQAVLNNYPNLEEAPVYASMSIAFWDVLQQTNNLRSACNAARDIITARPEALALLNRYGSRSPTYSASDLCPF